MQSCDHVGVCCYVGEDSEGECSHVAVMWAEKLVDGIMNVEVV